MIGKWSITMVIISPRSRVVPFPTGLNFSKKMGVIRSPLTSTGMILQAGSPSPSRKSKFVGVSMNPLHLWLVNQPPPTYPPRNKALLRAY